MLAVFYNGGQVDRKHLRLQADFLHKGDIPLEDRLINMLTEISRLNIGKIPVLSLDKTLHSHQAVIKYAGHEISSKFGFKAILQIVRHPSQTICL